jgi:hypothetical protein
LVSNVAVWNTRGIVRLPVGDIDSTGGKAGGAVVSFPQPVTLKVAAARTMAVLESHALCIKPPQKQE